RRDRRARSGRLGPDNPAGDQPEADSGDADGDGVTFHARTSIITDWRSKPHGPSKLGPYTRWGEVPARTSRYSRTTVERPTKIAPVDAAHRIGSTIGSTNKLTRNPRACSRSIVFGRSSVSGPGRQPAWLVISPGVTGTSVH